LIVEIYAAEEGGLLGSQAIAADYVKNAIPVYAYVLPLLFLSHGPPSPLLGLLPSPPLILILY
jgi:hypothetical protein